MSNLTLFALSFIPLSILGSAWAEITLSLPGPKPFIINTETTINWKRAPGDPVTFWVSGIDLANSFLFIDTAVEVLTSQSVLSGSMVYTFLKPCVSSLMSSSSTEMYRSGDRKVIAVTTKEYGHRQYHLAGLIYPSVS